MFFAIYGGIIKGIIPMDTCKFRRLKSKYEITQPSGRVDFEGIHLSPEP
jgi:hypothetical protein